MDEGPCDEDRGTPRMGGWHIPDLLLARGFHVPGRLFDGRVANDRPPELDSDRHTCVGVSNHLQGRDGPRGATKGGDLCEGLVSRGCRVGSRQRLPHGEFVWSSHPTHDGFIHKCQIGVQIRVKGFVDSTGDFVCFPY